MAKKKQLLSVRDDKKGCKIYNTTIPFLILFIFVFLKWVSNLAGTRNFFFVHLIKKLYTYIIYVLVCMYTS